MTQIERIIEILNMLDERPYTKMEFVKNFKVSERTIERDVNLLKRFNRVKTSIQSHKRVIEAQEEKS